jgi:MerR family transcriptional regulator, heat shock protein HspR
VDILRLKYIHKLLDEGGLNIAAIRTLLAIIPCWAIRKCSDEEREKCQGFKSDAYPCWEAFKKGSFCRNTTIRECDAYRIEENYPDV